MKVEIGRNNGEVAEVLSGLMAKDRVVLHPGDRVVELKQRSRLLRQAMTSLPEEQASLLRLAFFEDKSHSAIAEQLTLPLGTVKSRLRLAMTKLRSALKDLQ